MKEQKKKKKRCFLVCYNPLVHGNDGFIGFQSQIF